MRRFLVPSVLTTGITILAITIIGVVVARSPYTHGNLASAAGYTRTQVTYIGDTYLFQGMPLKHPANAQTGNDVRDGQLLFFQYGCASCHGVNGQGGAVGKDLQGDSSQKVRSKVRNPSKGMPVFTTQILPDADLEKLIAFLQSLE